MSPFAPPWHQNHLLGSLGVDGEEVRQHLRRVELAAGQVLCGDGRALKGLLFPTTAIVSISCLAGDGNSAEVAVVGNDGVIGFGLTEGADPNPFRVVVQAAGAGYMTDGPALAGLAGDRLAEQIARFSRSLVAQIAQAALCARCHSLEQQLCRRLLMGLDRSPHGALWMTHEATALLIGVRREAVSISAHRLRQAGVIDYRRGHIEVIDRPRLEARACECYAVAKRAYERHRPRAACEVQPPALAEFAAAGR